MNFVKTLRSFKSNFNRVENDNNEGQYKVQTQYRFLTGIVKEVVSNPYEFLNRKLEGDNSGNTLKDYMIGNVSTLPNGNAYTQEYQNSIISDIMPMNSITAFIVNNNQSKDGSLPVIAFPFFSSHFSLPIKPGEYVWILMEDHGKTKYYYWISRKIGILQTEDANFTNEEREIDINDLMSVLNQTGDFFNVDPDETKSLSTIDKSSEGNLPESLNMTDIFQSSLAYSTEHTGEPVPRLLKDCSDVLIQGSNNAGIHITKEKFSIESEVFKPDLMTNKNLSDDIPINRKPLSPAIDIFVQRKREDLLASSQIKAEEVNDNSVKIVKNNSLINSDYEYYEVNKNADLLLGDGLIHQDEIIDEEADAIDIASRLYLTANSNFDKVFKTNFDVLSEKSGAAAILYGQNTRLISNGNTRITSNLGESFVDLDEEGNVVIKASKGGAYISLKKDGSIAIVPGPNGLLYLGGDEGEAINIPLGNRKQPGDILIGTPIVSTMGGVIGDPSPSTGNFATKVLIK